jgi:hypothetical protein
MFSIKVPSVATLKPSAPYFTSKLDPVLVQATFAPVAVTPDTASAVGSKQVGIGSQEISSI